MKKLANEYLQKGWTHFKMKVGQDIERDIHRCDIIRNVIGNENILMVDSNQIWSVKDSIENIKHVGIRYLPQGYNHVVCLYR